jgi:hypothetical protein
VLGELLRELADRRRLPGPVDADDEDDARVLADVQSRGLAEERADLLGERGVEVGHVPPRLQPPYELRGRFDADVPRDQRLFEPLPRRLVAGIECRSGKFAGQRAAALAERVPQPREEPAAGLLVGLFGRVLGAEELRPGAAHALARAETASRRRDTTWETPLPPIVTP